MEPVIRNYRSIYTPGGPAAQLIGLDDNPPTCTMSYSEIYPDKTSAHHIHPWEHEVYIIQGAGTLVCDGTEYPLKEGDGLFIPENVDHYTLNNGGQGVMRRIVVNPLIAAQSGGPRNVSHRGSGKPPVIRNYRDMNAETGYWLLGGKDGVPNYVMVYSSIDRAVAGGNAHPSEHLCYILQGPATLVCDGKEYAVAEGDAVLVPPNAAHQWRRKTSDLPLRLLAFNPGAHVSPRYGRSIGR